MPLVGEPSLIKRPLVGEPRFAGSPWSEAPKAGLQTHPFLRKYEAMPASLTLSRRSRTPATLSLGRKNKKNR